MKTVLSVDVAKNKSMIMLMNSNGEILIDTKELEKIFKLTRIYDDTALNFIKEFPHAEIVKEKRSKLFHKREDNISNRTLEEREQIKQLLNKNNKDYENILIAIDNVPEFFGETRKLLKKNVDIKLET